MLFKIKIIVRLYIATHINFYIT